MEEKKKKRSNFYSQVTGPVCAPPLRLAVYIL